MSALDFAARGMALRGLAQRPRLFADLAAAQLPTSVNRIDSSGHATAGWGQATYVSDDLATASLAAAHPLAVFQGADGRYFRLAGDRAGMVTPEQVGCPKYQAGINQQPFIQAAIRYAEATGLSGVVLPQRTYELWCPQRTGAYTDQTHKSGHFIVIEGRIALVGGHPIRTKLHCRGPNGGSLETDFQVLNTPTYGGDVIWRGHGIFITGTVSTGLARLPDENLATITLRNLILYSDARGTRNVAWPAFPASRDPTRVNCWDTSNKGINFQANVQSGDVRAENVDIIGFLGECIYTSHLGQGAFYGRNIVCKHSNGQALNPNGPRVFDIDGFESENCGFTIEGWAGQGYARIVNARFKDSLRGNLNAGTGWAVQRRDDGSLPTLEIDALFQNCGDIYVGSGVFGKVTLIDSQLAVVGMTASQTIEDVTLDAVVVADAATSLTAVRFATYTGAAARSIRNVNISLNCTRTRAVREAGRAVLDLMTQSGSLGPEITVRAKGIVNRVGAVLSGPLPDFYASLVDEGIELLTAGATLVYPQTTPSPVVGSGWLRLAGTAAGTTGIYPVTLPSTSQFNDSATLIIEHKDDSSTAVRFEIDGLLLGYKDRIKLRAHKRFNKWIVVERPARLKTAASIALPAIAVGQEAGPFTIALTGARARHEARVVPAADLPGLVVSAVRAETDQIRFWMKNIDGAVATTAGNASFTALLGDAA